MKVFVIVLCLSFALYLSATIINIPDDQPTIQEGINVSVAGDTVLVHPGTYVENINFNGKAISVTSLFLTTQDTTYIHQTIINGNENGSVVTFESGEDNNSILVGYTITNGYPGFGNDGGGIYCEGSSPVLKNLIISENTTYAFGGGIYCGANSCPNMESIIVTSNYAAGNGGGIYCEESSNPNLENVIISMNSSEDGAGGLAAIYSSPTLTGVDIYGNSSYDSIAGILLFYSNATLTNVFIAENWGLHFGGGGIAMQNSSPILTNVTITNNSANESGGGMSCYLSNPGLVDVEISNNFADSVHDQYGGGAGIWSYSSTLNLNNVVLSGNYSAAYGGGIHCSDFSAVNLENVTIRDNYADAHGGGIYCENSFLNFSDENRSSINSNTLENAAGIGKDIYATGCDMINVIVDTFTVMIPTDYYAYPIDNFTFDILNSVGANENEIQILGRNLSNHPNPFNPSTSIQFNTGQGEEVEVKIYNIKGQKVKTLPIKTSTNRLIKSVVWNGNDDSNNPVSSGVYLYKLNVNGKTEAVNKCLLLK